MRRTSHRWDHLPSSSSVIGSLALICPQSQGDASPARWRKSHFAHTRARRPWLRPSPNLCFPFWCAGLCLLSCPGTRSSALSRGMDVSCAHQVVWKDRVCTRKLHLGIGLPSQLRPGEMRSCGAAQKILSSPIISSAKCVMSWPATFCLRKFTNWGKALALLWSRQTNKGA